MTGKDLVAAGWPEGRVIGLALKAAEESGERSEKVLDKILDDPEPWVTHPTFGATARELIRAQSPAVPPENPLRDTPQHYPVWGEELIDDGAKAQMDLAMQLPITVGGALMPDAQVGYGLPVGGVLATHDTVIPYAVGVDIACRMHLSVFEIDADLLETERDNLADILLRSTNFGAGGKFKPGRRPDHPVLSDPRWDATQFLKQLQDTAVAQLGTSGSGNHFVEWGVYEDCAGPRVAILSHSGSRGVGFKICNKYAKVAKQEHPELPDEAKELAWLGLAHELGQEYMLSMQLAGDFAAANHEVIHEKMASHLGLEPHMTIDHHHNYAWRETHKGQSVIVHRKGATPAARGELGVIPGDSVRGGYAVVGRGNDAAINSASHGAGRVMSRRKANENLSREAWQQMLADKGIVMIGGGLDEAPMAYKDIDDVMGYQTDLVHSIGAFTPRIVRMDNGNSPLKRRRNQE